MSSRDKSLLDKSGSAQSAFFDYVVPSKIFDVRNFDYLHLEHNSSIAALTNPVTLSYTDKLDQILNVLQEPEIAAYQSRLLRKAVKGISAKGVDIDHIQIGLKLTDKDFAKLVCEKKGVGVVKIKERAADLVVATRPAYTKNDGFKEGDLKPFYSHKYRMKVGDDEYRYIDVYFADPNHPKNRRELDYNCLIEFIPTRLTPNYVSFMLYQFQSVLGPRRYPQLFESAHLLRIDTGYVMYGVSQLYGFIFSKNNRVTSERCIPDKKGAVETTYVGHHDNSHVIGYDKVLKEYKYFIKQVFDNKGINYSKIVARLDGINNWFISQASSYRVESRYFLSPNEMRLVDMEKHKSLLSSVSFILPSAVCTLKCDEMLALIKDKKLSKVRSLLRKLTIRFKANAKKYKVSFEEEEVDAAFLPKLQKLKAAIFNPKKILTKLPLANYSSNVSHAWQAVKPFVDAQQKAHEDPEVIASSNSPAIYVEGCPGSGKTSLIVDRVAYLVSKGVPAQNVCVLAFTNKAAEEFQERLQNKGLLQADMFVGTFSAWCNQKLLRRAGRKVIDQEESIELILSFMPKKGFAADEFDYKDISRLVFSLLSHAANFDEPDIKKCIRKVAPQLTSYVSKILKVIKEYERWKTENGCLDFNDLLTKARELLSTNTDAENKALSKAIRHLIIDEVQDTNTTQWEIVKRLFEAGTHLFCVGDPAQSMYGFRGANEQRLRKFTSEFADGARYQLTENYRSTPEIVALTNLLRFKINRNYIRSIAINAKGYPVRLKRCIDLKSASEWLVQDMRANMQDSQIKSCLVLCRYTIHSDKIEKVLKKAGLLNVTSDAAEGVRVECMTYHKGKGLEADHCYVIDPLFSMYQLGSKKEELCNTYVAFTRAKLQLTVVVSENSLGKYEDGKDEKLAPSIFANLPIEDLELLA